MWLPSWIPPLFLNPGGVNVYLYVLRSRYAFMRLSGPSTGYIEGVYAMIIVRYFPETGYISVRAQLYLALTSLTWCNLSHRRVVLTRYI